jgi:hypothetical protein
MSYETVPQLESEGSKLASPFDGIRRVDELELEYWSARDLMPLLGYPRWPDFQQAIERAKASCQNACNPVSEHFRGLTLEIIGAGRPKQDCHLSRYAAYLVAQNGDPRKPEIAAAQSYFIAKTREAETSAHLLEDVELKKLELMNENIRLRIQLAEVMKDVIKPDAEVTPFVPRIVPTLTKEQCPPVQLPAVSTRTQINNIAQRQIMIKREQLLAQGILPADASKNAAQYVWRRINKEFRDRYHLDLKARTRKDKKTRLEVAEEISKLPELYSLVVALYGTTEE